MVLEEPTPIYYVTPVDLTGVRDTGMQSLIMLAVSLGWNVMQKHGQPVVITARDGVQKRLPTNTSIRMSVFQTSLSSIMAHTYDVEPTVELIDEIIKIAKPSQDHARRLRLAVGETPAQHRERLLNDRAAEQKREPDEHLTEHIVITGDEIELMLEEQEEQLLEFVDDLPPTEVEQGKSGEHGKLLSRGPFMAHHHSNAKGHKAVWYQSDTSLERVWEDGYKDYECVVCGVVYDTPKGVGAHSQVHKPDRTKKVEVPAWKRATIRGIDPDYVAQVRGPNKPKEEPAEVAARAATTEVTEADVENLVEGMRVGEILDKIVDLVMPGAHARWDAEMTKIIAERDAALQRIKEIEGEFDALVDLLTSRRRAND